MRFINKEDLFIGMTYSNTNNTLVKILKIHDDTIEVGSENWKRTYTNSIKFILNAINIKQYKLTKDTITILKSNTYNYEIY